jgi:hypothetical protein
MIFAELILTWSVVVTALGFAARVLCGRQEERFARGLFRADKNQSLR